MCFLSFPFIQCLNLAVVIPSGILGSNEPGDPERDILFMDLLGDDDCIPKRIDSFQDKNDDGKFFIVAKWSMVSLDYFDPPPPLPPAAYENFIDNTKLRRANSPMCDLESDDAQSFGLDQETHDVVDRLVLAGDGVDQLLTNEGFQSEAQHSDLEEDGPVAQYGVVSDLGPDLNRPDVGWDDIDRHTMAFAPD